MHERFGPYVIVRKIAKGGMAEVFLARKEGPAGFERAVCIKRILPSLSADPSFVDRFLDEARTAAKLSHPNIVHIYDLGEIDGSYYLAMEYVDGPSLRQVIAALREHDLRMPYHYAAKIAADVCAALDYAHRFTDEQGERVGVVHRDIAPDNILVGYNGAIKVIDFGIAKAVTNTAKTLTGAFLGKVAYASPEQVRQEPLDGRSDLFSLGVVLFELTTCVRPFGEGKGLADVSAIVRDPPREPAQLRPGYPESLRSIVMRALAKDREQRFASAAEMQRALEGFVHETGQLVTDGDIGAYVQALVRAREEDIEALRRMGSGVRLKVARQPEPSQTVVEPPPGAAHTPPWVRSLSEATTDHAAPAVPPAQTLVAPAGAPTRGSVRRRGLFVGLVMTVLVAAGAGGWWFFARSPDAGPRHATRAMASARPDEATAGQDRRAARPNEAASASEASASAPARSAPGPSPGAIAGKNPPSKGGKVASDHASSSPPAAQPGASPGSTGARPGPAAGHTKEKPLPPGQGRLVVSSNPPALEVYVDGARRGRTPLTLLLPAGRHSVELKGERGIDRVERVEVHAGRTARLRVELVRGTLVFAALPRGVEVRVDGKLLGKTPLAPYEVSEGTHVIELRHPHRGKKLVTIFVSQRTRRHVLESPW